MRESRVKIVSGGDALNTKVFIDGKECPNVRKVTWTVDTKDYAVAAVELENVAVEVEGSHRCG